MPVQDGAMGDREGTEGATATGRGRIPGGEENGGEVAVILSLGQTAPSNNQPHDGNDGGGGRQWQ